ncbi:lipopolysaccharide assembly protein LapA domain-containing protein [Microvirga sp. W0021]|uniref:Lipopolysaccharide assembly protein LapA domain-containing protein n=1 Tax=Hohaiivirga grylli TaxID=3133970 RepID=A0ABV0BGZ1_9HYPH
MIRFLKVLVFILVAMVVVFLSIANRHAATLSLDPFSQVAPEFSITAPLFLILFGAVAFGVFIGGTAAWWAQHKKRKELRQSKREIRNLKAEAEKMREEAAARNPVLPAPDRVN